MLKKLVFSLLAIAVLGVGGLTAYMYAAPEKFSQWVFAAGRYHAGLERKEITKYRKAHPDPVYLTTVLKELS